ncbi:OmpA family protein [Phenylobacterium aquaticum]|uniref:OmpA family protein n=1 Tax=Phenylobacterium aquaticum TaxID=1763816 RepID=UPI0026F07829|nr:OmpA family protein [Phenylobacterium aquaticum]
MLKVVTEGETVNRLWKLSLAAALAVQAAGCASLPARMAMRPPVCGDMRVQIYFEPDSAEVTDEGRAVISAASSQAKTCKVDRVSVLGLADAAGTPQANLELSQRRADAVGKVLAANGLPSAQFDKTAAGQAGAVTASGDIRPLRRRADVVLELSRPH